jgi:hypothetical protein
MSDDEPDGPDADAIRAKQSQALRLRTAGTSWGTIAEQLGYANPSGAWHAANAARKREAVDEDTSTRAESDLTLARLDRLLRAVWPAASQGNVDAVDRAIRIMRERARVLIGGQAGSAAEEDPDIVATRERFAERRAAARLADPEDSGSTAV